MENQYRYVITIGTKEVVYYGIDDRKARRIAAAWVSMFWDKFKENVRVKYPGSMADAVNHAWSGDPPRVQIGRILLEGGVAPCKPYTIIEDFPLDSFSKEEFIRAYRKH